MFEMVLKSNIKQKKVAFPVENKLKMGDNRYGTKKIY